MDTNSIGQTPSRMDADFTRETKATQGRVKTLALTPALSPRLIITHIFPASFLVKLMQTGANSRFLQPLAMA